MKQINREGYDERSTRIMMSNPITELSRLIGAKWFKPLEKLAEGAGVHLLTVKKAIRGEQILPRYEEKLRDFLGKL